MRKAKGWAHETFVTPEELYKTEGFWGMHYALYDDTSVIVNGNHYRIARGNGPFKGFGGTKFTIKFFDGRVVECSNLWSQGTIDPEFRELLPDNAEFVGKPFGTH